MDAVVEVQSHKEAPSISCDEVKASYKTLVTFTTETTDNDKRNTNVRLAAEALNGTIVQPGEEFSFNSVVGQRTAEKDTRKQPHTTVALSSRNWEAVYARSPVPYTG